MKISHAAPLLLLGWYLIVPSYSKALHSVDSAAPKSSWSIVATFGGADACKQAVTELQRRDGDPAKLDATGKLRRFQKRQSADPKLERLRVLNATASRATIRV